jgi:poly-D-alanine transfer protein DltD|tara:strand:- start:86 stop:502 length:417 start_codon:yes stop_codon:yes gene_type:complete
MRSSGKSRNKNRNNGRRPNPGNVINRVFDSAGPEGKVRGTPQQIIEKYQSLAHDSQLSGDRVSAENFQQHSEHYARLLLEAQKEIAEKAAAQESAAEESGSNKEKTQNDNYETKVLSDVPSLKEQKAKISLEQNIDRA